MLKLFGGDDMQSYMSRLVKCGFRPYEASKICNHMLKNFDSNDLELLIASIEKEKECGYSIIQIQLVGM